MAALFCKTAGGLCLIYYLVIILYAGITADFAWIWLAAGAVLEIGAVLLRYGKKHPGFFPGWLCWAVTGALALGILVFLVICSRVILGMMEQGSKNLEYVVVLGAQVKGEVPSKALKKRLDRALEYAGENEDTLLILSGGQGSGEDISEAECMRRYLEEKGIPGERLILEEKSVNTRENLKFSDELTGCAQKRTGILSNDFHVYRGIMLARKLGYRQAEGIAAASDALMQAHYVVREVFALVKEKLVGAI